MRLIFAAVFLILIVLNDSQLVTYDINTQSVCSEVQESARNDCRWPAGLNLMLDKIVDGGLIIAYKVEWSNGNWSEWYIPRVNDIDHKFNPTTQNCEIPYRSNTLRRMWSYFTDHAHKYIICHFGNINDSGNKTTVIVPTVKTTVIVPTVKPSVILPTVKTTVIVPTVKPSVILPTVKTTVIVPTVKTTTTSITTTRKENNANNTTYTNNDFDDSMYNSFAAPVYCRYFSFYTIGVGILMYCFTRFI